MIPASIPSSPAPPFRMPARRPCMHPSSQQASHATTQPVSKSASDPPAIKPRTEHSMVEGPQLSVCAHERSRTLAAKKPSKSTQIKEIDGDQFKSIQIARDHSHCGQRPYHPVKAQAMQPSTEHHIASWATVFCFGAPQGKDLEANKSLKSVRIHIKSYPTPFECI